ncbi:Gfo/Idh/MocA family oxidoreductase [Flavivirga sp. 57AJ16]|nr:Gfo/Idh/MocA family oxidoreductase [Flavivirga sp. 57AJ16]MDD7885466.1 Gfo/Idh/MocA family oxidoreductase [Flavivirga sp. 57AJ16]
MSGQVFHLPFLKKHEGFGLHAVTERTKKNAQLQYEGIKSYDSVEALIHDDELELIVVNTPNNTHFEFAMQALHAGKHVLIEKPFTVTSFEAKALFNEAKNQNLYVLPYQNRRYDSDFLSVKEVLNSGKLGKPIEVHFRFDRYKVEPSHKIFKEDTRPGGGVLYDLGSHLIDGALSLFGIPQKWTKTYGKFRPDTKVDDYAQVHLSYADGLQVFITTSLLVADPGPAFVIHGTRGSYQKIRTNVQENQLLSGLNLEDPLFGVEASKDKGVLTVINENDENIQEKLSATTSSYLQVLEDVYQTIRYGKPYPVTEAQIIQQLEILEKKRSI